MNPGLRWHLPSRPPEAEHQALMAEWKAFLADRRALDLRGAKLFERFLQTGSHLHEGASSVANLAEAGGMTAHSARELEDLARALSIRDVEADVLSGRLPVANGAVLGRVDLEGDFRFEDDDWEGWARTMKPRDYLRKFLERREVVRRGQAVEGLTVFLNESDRLNFRRARTIASRRARVVLTEGQTLGVVVDEYLARHDPLCKEEGPLCKEEGPLCKEEGRKGERDPADDPPPANAREARRRVNGRYVRASVRRAVLRRDWDRCAVPFCDKDMYLQFSHRRAHRDGGTCDEDNLDLLCGWHHMLYEQGVLIIEGGADDPVFKTCDGRVLGESDCDADALNASADQRAAAERKEARDRRRESGTADASCVDAGEVRIAATGAAIRAVPIPPAAVPPPKTAPPAPVAPATPDTDDREWLENALYPRRA